MALPVEHTFARNASRDIVQAGKAGDIRVHGLRGNMNQDQKWSRVADACLGEECRESTLSNANGGLSAFSSTCWYFGESLGRKMGPSAPPIGLVHTAFGGSQIESWTTDEVTATCRGAQPAEPAPTLWDRHVLPYLDMSLAGWIWCE